MAIISARSASLGSSSPTFESSVGEVKRDSPTKASSVELEPQETGHFLPDAGYPHTQTADSGYGYDAGKNAYGKQASDWSLYDQGESQLGLMSRPAIRGRPTVALD